MPQSIIAAVLELLDSDSSSNDGIYLNNVAPLIGTLEELKRTARDNLSFVSKISDFSDEDFYCNFRLTRPSAKMIIEKYKSSGIAPKVNSEDNKDVTSDEREVYIFLWYMANTATLKQLGMLFGIEKVMAMEIVKRVSSWLVSIENEFIHWPTESEAVEISKTFESIKGIPGVIGAVGITHIKINKPAKNHEAYLNGSKYHSFTMQCIVDANKRFIDVHCGEPGSANESTILSRSNIYRKANQNKSALFPSGMFILGDSTYPCLDWLVPSFKDDGELTDNQQIFNTLHDSTRVIAENTISTLKARFTRIQFFTEALEKSFYNDLVKSACILSNISIQNNETDFEDNMKSGNIEAVIEEMFDTDFSAFPDQKSPNRRDVLVKALIEKAII